MHHLAIGREDREGARAVEMVDAAGIGQQAVEASHQGGLAACHTAPDQGGQQPGPHQVGAAAGLGGLAGGCAAHF